MSEEKSGDAQATIDPKLEELFRAGVHFGYARTRRHPRMREFIAGIKSNVEIFQLEKVWELFGRALTFIEDIGKQGKIILWVGTKPAANVVIRKIAEELGHPYVDIRWLGGTLTNFDIIRKRINYWQDLISKSKSGELEKYTKQERLKIQREIERLTRAFEGLVRLDRMPDALFVVDTNEEASALREATQKNIPVVALLNSDCDPAAVAYPIPGNDNASESIRFVLERAKEAYARGVEAKNAGNNGN